MVFLVAFLTFGFTLTLVMLNFMPYLFFDIVTKTNNELMATLGLSNQFSVHIQDRKRMNSWLFITNGKFTVLVRPPDPSQTCFIDHNTQVATQADTLYFIRDSEDLVW